MAQHVLVIVKAKNCTYCSILEKNLDNLKRQLTSAGISLRAKEINLESISHRIDPKVHPAGLSKIIGFFPFLALVPGHDWDAAVAKGLNEENNYDLASKISVFNGRMRTDGSGGFEAIYPPPRDLYRGGFLDWVKEAITLPQFTANPQAPPKIAGIPASVSASVPKFPSLITHSAPEKSSGSEVCTIRFISRRR